MSKPEAQTAETAPKPDGYVKQLIREWERAAHALASAAHEGREAQRRWDAAVSYEMEAHRRMQEAINERPATPPTAYR